jgi:hypothetical protein
LPPGTRSIPTGSRSSRSPNVAAYSGLRWGEIVALTVPQVGQAARVIAVDRKVVDWRAPVRRGAEEPEVPPDDLPPAYARRLPARRAARCPYRRGQGRAGSWERERDIIVIGSTSVVHTLMEHDLVDEYRLLVFPAVLGNGCCLFTSPAGAVLCYEKVER